MKLIINSPDLWRDLFPRPHVDGHKYHRGHVAIYGAPELTGATRLAAMACSRTGAGLVTVIARENADIYRITLPPDIMVRGEMPEKASVLLCGSGGVLPDQMTEALDLSDRVARVFDADALQAEISFSKLDERCVLTPHLGEFERMFGPAEDDLGAAALRAAALTGATVVLKSSKTLIATKDGQLVINRHTSAYLAKAGTGDVLAGMIAGLLAQGMPHFEACCAAVWMHGEAGVALGAGLISGDIPDILPGILKAL